MEDIFGPILLVTFCLLVSQWEFRKLGVLVTPFSALAWPYSLVVLLINVGGKHFGFFPVSLESIGFVVVSLAFFLLGGQLIRLVVNTGEIQSDRAGDRIVRLNQLMEFYRPLFITLVLVSIVAGAINLHATISELGWIKTGTAEFKQAYGKGVLAHLMLLGRPAFAFLFADFIVHKKKRVLTILVAIFVLVLVRQVKYHVIVLLLSGIYFSYIHGLTKVTLKKALTYSLVVYLVFNVSYLIGFSVSGLGQAYSSKVQAFLFNHFFTYLFGGPIGFSELLKYTAYPLYSLKEIISVPINLYRFIIGDSSMVEIIFPTWLPVSSIHQYFHSSNTFGIFGMSYLFLGTLGAFIYLFLLGVLSYLLRSLMLKYRFAIGYQLAYSLVLSFLTISFFGLYFNMLTFFEVTFFMLVLPPLYLLMSQIARLSLFRHRTEFTG